MTTQEPATNSPLLPRQVVVLVGLVVLLAFLSAEKLDEDWEQVGS